MSDLFLNLRDKARVVDFLVEQSEYADKAERERVAPFIRDYEEGAHVSTDKMAEAAKRIAISTWPARFALQRFFETEGVALEWQRVLSAVRPKTADALQRLHTSLGPKPLEKALRHADASGVIGDEEQYEIDEVRNHARHDYWKQKGHTLAVLVKDGEAHRDGYVHRLGKLRDVAFALTGSLQDEAMSKLAHFEDRIWMKGEIVPLEIIDEEISYYVDQHEINPLQEEPAFVSARKRPMKTS